MRSIIPGRGAACPLLSQPSPALDLLATSISFSQPRLYQLPPGTSARSTLPNAPGPASGAYGPPLASQGRCSIPINPQALKHATLGRCCCVCPIRPSIGTTKGRGSSKDLGKRHLCSHTLVGTEQEKPKPSAESWQPTTLTLLQGTHHSEQTLFLEGHLSLPHTNRA